MRIGGGKMWNVPGFPDEIGRRGFGNVGCQYFIHTYGRYNGRFVCRAPGRKYKSDMNLSVGKIENIGSEFTKTSFFLVCPKCSIFLFFLIFALSMQISKKKKSTN